MLDNIRAILARIRALPPNTARNWKPIGTRIEPINSKPIIISGNM